MTILTNVNQRPGLSLSGAALDDRHDRF